MSIQKKLDDIQSKQLQLEEEKKGLLLKRKTQIGDFAEKLKILTADDELLLGALALVKTSLDKNNEDELQRLRKNATPFLSKRKSK